MDNVDVGPPIQFKTIGICADGTFDPPLESLDLDFSSIPGRGGKICDLSGSGICTPFTIDFTEPELDIDLGDLAGIDADTTFLKNCVTEGNSCELMTRTNQINIKSNRLTDGIHDMCHWLLGDSGGLCHQIEGL